MVSHEGFKIQENLTENELIGALTQRLERELQRRHRLLHIHTLGHVVDLLKHSKNIMVLTGAGVSVSCGIPDFRSSDGIYSRLSEFELDDPTQMFELDFFQEKPQVFYSFAREIFPSNFTPSPSHNFIKLLEDQGKLLRNYTQNIDTLEQKAGICRILQCHGSFATASCLRCKHQVPGDDIKDVILKQEVAYCKVCQTATSPLNIGKKAIDGGSRTNGADDTRPAVMKPDIVFFGERLPTVFDDNWDEDRDKVDLLIVIGSSLKVAPVSDIMHQLPKHIPQILINRTPITHMEFDVQLLGNCDTIVAELCRMAGWELRHEKLPGGTSNVPGMDINTNADGSGKGGCAQWSVIEPNTYTFEGAILGDIEYESSQSFSKERARFGSSEAEGYDADTDDDDEHHRRLTGERRGSLGIMILDTDSESDSSQDTIRGQGSSLPSSLNDKVADDSVDSTL
ncbi:DHS-like NAD/FAD-binding domain-containing protein [Gamsiella multidivaricata]|uniref:DHS-like NAD/FAD-binding domain-containing protein n=1 Tax=Gamsiella multidivaricata TaxID=101098 RepID=UPI00221F4EE6|nr:DHS-like NAD/FAD-binding domain-containing protein [Gamsiella multidivaricata]KAI7829631.1 DHS-like NAD/FAD-binding domain-containing protein [Gamsiella multidivaricata]